MTILDDTNRKRKLFVLVCKPDFSSVSDCVFLSEYHDAFKCFDLNENGTLSTKELKYAMRMLGSNPTDSQVQQLVNAKDFDGKAYARDYVVSLDLISAK